MLAQGSPLSLKGRKFGNLKVLFRSKERRTRHYLWVCKCKCGRRHTVRGSLLVDGKITRCRKCSYVAGQRKRLAKLKLASMIQAYVNQ